MVNHPEFKVSATSRYSSSVSGGESVYFIPNNNDAWEKKDYIHIDTESLLAMPDADRHAVK